MLQLDESSSGKTIDLQVGQTVELDLSESPTTGFRWVLVARGEPACALISDLFEPGVGRPGQAGRHRWQFQAVRAAEGTIELRYRRSWEQPTASSKAFTLTVRVRP